MYLNVLLLLNKYREFEGTERRKMFKWTTKKKDEKTFTEDIRWAPSQAVHTPPNILVEVLLS